MEDVKKAVESAKVKIWWFVWNLPVIIILCSVRVFNFLIFVDLHFIIEFDIFQQQNVEYMMFF